MFSKNGVVLGIALVLSSIILCYGLVNIRQQNNYVSVKGLSEREVMADKAWWSINTQISANTTQEMQEQIKSIESKIKAFYISKGFTEGEINTPSLNVYYNNYREAAASLTGDYKLSVTTDDIEKVRSAIKSTGDLIAKGILIQSDPWSSGPKYYFTKFKELKKEMLAEAAQEAKAAAGEFAINSETGVGKIRNANQGIFQILPGNRTEESEIFFPDKVIRVVSSVDYYLD